MRRVAISIGVVVIVIAVAALIFAATFNANKYRGTIQSELQKRLGRRMVLGNMHLGVFPPRIQVQDLAIADDPGFSPDAPFVKAKELDVSVKLLPLLHKQIEIDSLDLQRPNVNLIRNQAGVWNFASLGHPPRTGNEPAEQPEQSNHKNAPATSRPSQQPAPGSQTGSNNPSQRPAEEQFSLGELTIRDGQVALLDQQKSNKPTLYDHIDVSLKNLASNQPFTIDAAVNMPGTGSQDLRLQGEGGPIDQQDLAKTPFHGTLNLKQVGMADLSKFLDSPALGGTDGI